MGEKILFYGTEPAPYHPMRETGERIRALLQGTEMEITAQEEALLSLESGRYAVCMLYTDFEQPPLKAESAAALLSFAAKGGGIFAIHGGIGLQNRPEIAQLLGGTFTEHPPYEELPLVSYKVTDVSHPITKGVTDFVMPDELYRFDLPPLEDRHIFLSYEENGVLYPAGWTRQFGLGKVIYLCCGHNAGAFKNEMLARLICNGTEWLKNQ